MDEKRLYKAIGAKIREIRRKHLYKQRDLAEKIGLERTSITNIETGKQKVTVSVLYKISIVFQVDITSLLPNPEDLVEHNLDTNNEGDVSIGSKTYAVLQSIRGD